jgi:hypothetical protein
MAELADSADLATRSEQEHGDFEGCARRRRRCANAWGQQLAAKVRRSLAAAPWPEGVKEFNDVLGTSHRRIRGFIVHP